MQIHFICTPLPHTRKRKVSMITIIAVLLTFYVSGINHSVANYEFYCSKEELMRILSKWVCPFQTNFRGLNFLRSLFELAVLPGFALIVFPSFPSFWPFFQRKEFHCRNKELSLEPLYWTFAFGQGVQNDLLDLDLGNAFPK